MPHPARHGYLCLAFTLLAALAISPAIAQDMGGGMGGVAVGGGGGAPPGTPQGYITAPPIIAPSAVQPQPTAPGSPSMSQVAQPDKCKTCVNCLTESCQRMCWQRYCRR